MSAFDPKRTFRSHRACSNLLRWIERDRPQRAILDVFECHSERAGRAVDHHLAKKLQSIRRCKVVALCGVRGLVKGDMRTERGVKRNLRPGPRMQRPGNEFPERLEILKHGPVRIVIMRGGVVQVGGEPERIGYASTFNEDEQVGDLEARPRGPSACSIPVTSIALPIGVSAAIT